MQRATNRVTVTICGVLLSLTMDARKRQTVFIRNDSPYSIAVGFYRTKNNHMALDTTQSIVDGKTTLSYSQFSDVQPLPLAHNVFYILRSGQDISLPFPDQTEESLRDNSRHTDLWYSHDISQFVIALAEGALSESRSPSQRTVRYMYVKPSQKNVFIVATKPNTIAAFATEAAAQKARDKQLPYASSLSTTQVVPESMTAKEWFLSHPEESPRF